MTAFPSYSTGTVSVAANGTVVTGTGSWGSVNARPGDKISINGSQFQNISDVTDLTHLALMVPWSGADQSSVPYIISQESPLRFVGGQAMADVSAMVAALNTNGFNVFVPPNATAPDPSLGEDQQYATQETTGKKWQKYGGIWNYLGVYGTFATRGIWSSATAYSTNDIVTFAGKLYLALMAGSNQQPDTSPTYWEIFLAGGDTVYIAMDDSDRPASGETVLKFISPKAMTIFAGMTDSYAKAATGATLSAVYSIQKNGTQFGAITFAAAGQGGAQSGAFACASNAVFAAGDILTLVAPTPRDATLSTIGITITGYR